MAAYLQRLLDTAAPIGAGPLGLAPVVRSSSPVFEQNQLIALEEPVAGPSEARLAELPALEPSAPSEARLAEPPAFEPGAPWQEPAPVESGLHGEPRPAPVAVPPATRAAPLVPADRPPVAAASEDIPVPDAPAPAADPAVATVIELPRQPPMRRDRRPAPIEPAPLTPPRPPAAAAERVEVAQAAPPASPPRPAVAEPANADRREEAPRGRATEREEIEPHILPREVDEVRAIDPPAAPDPAPEPPRSYLSPRPPPDPVPPDPNREAQAGSAEPVQPTITIGHVTVEVVEDSQPGSAPPQALSAASASMIGPLGQARAARRLFALRRL
jgi:nicotinate-nucleotide--dimethylbenzimidazole phosphoribosyltransferase